MSARNEPMNTKSKLVQQLKHPRIPFEDMENILYYAQYERHYVGKKLTSKITNALLYKNGWDQFDYSFEQMVYRLFESV